ncbi:MAG: glycosyltransferase family 4 protein, partial [Verrucomicrobiota bacterium]
YDLAKAWHGSGVLGAYHSGYPGWKLRPPAGFPLRSHAWRTVTTYAALRLPRAVRPDDERLFRWQDGGFDRAVGKALRREDGELVHALPGQALHTFRAARHLGVETCLNHASGPLHRQLQTLRETAEKAGQAPPREPVAELERRAAETALADWHCVASTIVRDQLLADGIGADRIWVCPYAADERVFYPSAEKRPAGKRIVFAGQITARKGLGVLFAALRRLPGATLDCYGPAGADAAAVLAGIDEPSRIRLHGAVPQAELGERFRAADLLVLPSWEEAFGLVVPQALACGIPVVISDRVGARDIVAHREQGSIFPAGDADALAGEIAWWLDHPECFQPAVPTWPACADRLLDQIQRRHMHSPTAQ